MALITISGEPGCPDEELARVVAQKLEFELITEGRLDELVAEEFGPGAPIRDEAYKPALLSVLARLATERHLVIVARGMEHVFRSFQGVLRIRVVAPEPRRAGMLMLDRRLDRPSARRLLRALEQRERAVLKQRFRRARASADMFDLVLNAGSLDAEQMAAVIESAVDAKGLREQGLLSTEADARLQFQARLQLSRYGVVPAGPAGRRQQGFSHPSEEIFANLLDFYRIAWQYEPRSFPIQWDKDDNVLESFTPDFYLPEFDLYVELTTMKQALVTKKNRKVRLMREIYPHINIQVFYQKDFQNLIFKYGLTGKLAGV